MTDAAPTQVTEYADQAVAYVQRALGVPLAYDSDTLPVLDHYLRTVPQDQPAALQLVLATAGAYFGEVIRRRLGGRWELDDKPAGWRVVLPTSISFSPVAFVATAVAQDDLEDFDSEIGAPPRMMTHLQETLARMGELTVEEYYSLCGRLDTLEHVNEVLVAIAAQMLGDAGDAEGEGEAQATDLDAEEEAAGSVN